MTTQTVAITLTTSTYTQNPNGNTVITTGPAVINTYSPSVVLNFTNEAGTLDSTGTVAGNQSSGIFLSLGNVAGAQARIGNLGGLITGYDYGVFLASHTAVSNSAFVFNSGTIVSRAKAYSAGTDPDTAGIFGGQGTNVTISNGGTIIGGEGVFLQTNDTFTQTVINDANATIAGTINENGNFYGIKIQDNNNGLVGGGSVFNAGVIVGLIDIAAKYGSVTNSSTGTIGSGLFALGTGTLELEAGGSFAGGANFLDGAANGLNLPRATLLLNAGTTGSVGTLANPGNYNGFGGVTVQAGADWTVGSAAGTAGFSGVTTISDFATLNVAGLLSGNTIDMEGSIAGTSTKVEFTGSNTSTPIVDYSKNDQIVLDNLPSGSGTSYKDAYNTATGVLTVTEYNAAGAAIGSDTLTLSAAPGTTIAPSGSFIEISGPGGPTIVLGNSSLVNAGSIFIDNGGFYTLSNTSGVDTVPVTFGLNGTSLALNTLDLNGTVTGTNSPYQGTISGFGLNDDIVLSSAVLPSQILGGQDVLSYSGSLLSVTEFNASGASIGSTTIDVGTGYTASNFVALLGSAGVNIETADTVRETPLTFNATGTANFETTTDYSGGLAPGSSIVSGETVIIASGTAAVSVTAPVSNSGTIIVAGASSAFLDAGTLSGNGTIVATGGGAVTLATASGTVDFGTATSGAPNVVDLNGSPTGFTGTIGGFGANDEIVLGTNVLAPASAGTSYSDSYNTATGVLTVSEVNAAGATVGSTSLTVANTGSFTAGSFVDIAGPNGVTLALASTQLGNTGSIFIDHGQQVTLSNTSGVDTIPVTFGSNGTSLALNVLDLNGTVTGTNSPYQGAISGFGLNDDIILGASVLPSQILGGQDVLSYTGSLLSATEFNASGVSIGSSTIDVGTGYAASDFVALLGSAGVNIETADTVRETPLTFNATGTANFETTTDYSGGLAPGSSIVTGETVIIASGTAAVSVTAPVSNSGTIIVSGASSGFLDAGTLSGNGTIIATAGGTVTLATAAGTVDFGTATSGAPNVVDLNGSPTGFTGTIGGFGANDEIVIGTNVLAPGGAGTTYVDSYDTASGVLTVSEINSSGATVGSTSFTVANTGGSLTSGSFVDISGPNGVTLALASTQLGNTGSIFIDNGQQVTLSNTTGVDTIPVTFGSNGTSLALNVLDLNGTVTGTNSPYQGAISGFGLNDDIVLGASVLPTVGAGDTVTLSYAGSLLTVTELDSTGASIGSTTLDVGTGYAAGSFAALLGANGINIETVQTVEEQNFTFGPLTPGTNYQGDFENPADYAGGVAPGSTIFAGETVTVQSPAQANVTSSLTNNGVIVLDANNSNLLATAAISGTGTIKVGGNSTLVLANTIGTTTDTIAFGSDGTDNVLRLDGAGTASFAGTITGIGGNDEIDLGASFLPTPSSASAITLNYNSTSGVLTISDTVGGTIYTDTLNIAGPVPGGFSAAVSGGNIVITDVPCFASGTRILTPDGERRIEDLAIGDEVITTRGNAAQKIIWAGHRTIDISRHANPEKIIPVLIKAGAFGAGLPERDLRVSPDHALYIDGHLIEAKTLVNGATIIRDHAAKFVTYHHIELETHDVVLAEGLPAETYLDSGNRQNFETDAGPLALHPDFAAASREAACAPLLLDGDIVRRIKQELLDRALALGFTRTADIDLVAKANGRVIAPQMDETGREILFVLPANARDVALLSSAGVPAETCADPSDRRLLGAAITGLTLIAGGKRTMIDLNGAYAGFHDAEPGQRWTNGNAVITLPAHTGRAILKVTLAGQATRWLAPAAARQFVNG
jgi:hypothetical protein